MNITRTIFLAILILNIFSFGFAKEKVKEKENLILGIPPWGGTKEEVSENFKPLIEYLSEKINKKIIFTTTSDYGELEHYLSEGVIDIGIFSPIAYIDLKKNDTGIKYLCSVVDKNTLLPSYYSVIFVRKDSNIKNYKDLKEKLLAFVDEKSASGYQIPLAIMLSKWKIKPENYFKKVLFLGSHPNVIQAVYDGNADAGASGGASFDKWLKEHGDNPFTFIEKEENIPYDAIVTTPAMDKKYVEELRGAFLSITKNTAAKDGKTVLDKFPWGGFIVKDDSFYDGLRQTQKIIRQNSK